jgi:hypothetical protein
MPEMFRKARHHGLYLVVRRGESTDRCAASVVPCCSVQIPAHPRAIRRLFVLSSGSPVVKHWSAIGQQPKGDVWRERTPYSSTSALKPSQRNNVNKTRLQLAFFDLSHSLSHFHDEKKEKARRY